MSEKSHSIFTSFSFSTVVSSESKDEETKKNTKMKNHKIRAFHFFTLVTMFTTTILAGFSDWSTKEKNEFILFYNTFYGNSVILLLISLIKLIGLYNWRLLNMFLPLLELFYIVLAIIIIGAVSIKTLMISDNPSLIACTVLGLFCCLLYFGKLVLSFKAARIAFSSCVLHYGLNDQYSSSSSSSSPDKNDESVSVDTGSTS